MKPVASLLPVLFIALAGTATAQAPAEKNRATTPAPLAAEPAAAQSTPAAEPTPARPQNRAVSPALAAALAERMPKYNPPPPPREPTEEELEESQPKNRIVRLPQMIVEGQRPPVFRERDINTKKGMAELAMSRYLSELDRGLNRYTLPLFGQSNEQRALAQYAEEERLQNMQSAEESAQMIRASEGEDAAEDFRDAANATFIRTPYLPEPSSMNRD